MSDLINSLTNGGIFGILILVLLAIWAILWFILPFMVYGIDEKLKKQNKLLEKLIKNTSSHAEE